MEDIKSALYNLLDEIEDVTILQGRPEVIASFPTVTFSISENTPRYTLDKDIGHQDISIDIDIWADTPSETGTLLSSIEEILRDEGYRLTFSSDLPDPEGKARITTVFNLIK